jgi:hypothetical protein
MHNAPEIPVEVRLNKALTEKSEVAVDGGVFVVTGGLGGLGQALLRCEKLCIFCFKFIFIRIF